MLIEGCANELERDRFDLPSGSAYLCIFQQLKLCDLLVSDAV